MKADVLGPQRVGLLQHPAWDFWFAPKHFECPLLYERLGVPYQGFQVVREREGKKPLVAQELRRFFAELEHS